MKLAPISLLAAALAAATSAGPAAWIGLEMPASGIDGGEGLAARTAVRLIGSAVIARDSARGGFLNPHQDEGVDNDVDVREAPAIIAGFAADPRVRAVIGGLRRRVGDADAIVAQARQLPTMVLSRWSRNSPSGAAFCLCASPERLVEFAHAAARKRFGPRLLLVLLGDAAALEPIWIDRWGRIPIVEVSPAAGSVAAARRRAGAADAVLVLADERPPTLWQSATFRRSFDLEYARNLGHRDFAAVPAGAARGSVATIVAGLASGADRQAFVRRFHAAAGYVPGDAATRAYAAAQIVAAAGGTRAEVLRALRVRPFSTVAGTVTFDADGFSRPFPVLSVGVCRTCPTNDDGGLGAAETRWIDEVDPLAPKE
jgi:hypothetical protein